VSYAQQLFEQIRRRRVLQVVIVYAGAAWVLAEASQFLIDNYDLPRKLLDTMVYLLVVGFPAAAVIAWYHGERGPQRPTRMELALLATLGVLGLAGGYQIATAPAAEEDPSDESAVDLGDASVAVMPFDNQIADPELAWLGQGLAELLTTGLAQLDALRVVSGQRLFDLLRQEGREGTEAIPDDLAMRLSRRSGARYMVRGTVLGRRDDITLNANLINVRSGEVAAAARARGADAFALVDQLSAELSSQILAGRRTAPANGQGLIAGELAPVAEITTRDIEAYRAYQLGQQAERRFRLSEAKEHYERAVQLDPAFALAHLQLGRRELDDENASAGIRELLLAKRNLTAASERDRLLIDGLIAAMVQDDDDLARANFQEIVRKHPDDKEGLFWLWQLSEGEEQRRLSRRLGGHSLRRARAGRTESSRFEGRDLRTRRQIRGSTRIVPGGIADRADLRLRPRSFDPRILEGRQASRSARGARNLPAGCTSRRGSATARVDRGHVRLRGILR
jgi:TolB-like protein